VIQRISLLAQAPVLVLTAESGAMKLQRVFAKAVLPLQFPREVSANVGAELPLVINARLNVSPDTI